MNDRVAKKRTWRIGELAAATGLTVRSLRHYEGVGLLDRPSRTAGKQRSYDERDVRRLYRICALRDLGLSLSEIGQMLTRDRTSFGAVLRAHRTRVDVEIQRLRRLGTLLEAACARSNTGADSASVLGTIEAMSRVSRRGTVVEKERRNNGDADRTEADRTEAEWRQLGDELRACLDKGESPNAPRPLALARRARAKIIEFAGGDAKTLEALAHLRRFAPPQDLAGWDPALMQYLDRALSCLAEQGDAAC